MLSRLRILSIQSSYKKPEVVKLPPGRTRLDMVFCTIPENLPINRAHPELFSWYVWSISNSCGANSSKHAIEDLKTAGSEKISFRLHGQQHNFTADSTALRDGFHKALKEKIAEAQALKDDILNRASYKETHEKLGMLLWRVLKDLPNRNTSPTNPSCSWYCCCHRRSCSRKPSEEKR
jgi:hypothetical protein